MSDVAGRLRALADAATPGPWEHRVWGVEGDKWPDRRVSVGTTYGHGAAVCISPRYGDPVTTLKDARLIALAPELARGYADALDALADIAEGRWNAGSRSLDIPAPPYRDARQYARAALAEADRLLGDAK